MLKASLECAKLQAALEPIESLLERHHTMPVLNHIKIADADGGLRLTATDMEMDIEKTLPAALASKGAITVPGRLFHDIARSLPSDKSLTLEAGDNLTTTVVCGRARFQLRGLPVDEFPPLKREKHDKRFAVDAAGLAALLRRVDYAMPRDQEGGRNYLNGVHIHQEATQLRCVATDGHRLALGHMPLPDGADALPAMTLPRKAVGELTKLLELAVKEDKTEAQLAFSERALACELADSVFTARLLEARYPDYKSVVPKEDGQTLVVAAEDFYRVVERVALVSEDKAPIVSLSAEGRKLTVKSVAADAHSGSEEMDAQLRGEPFEVRYNARFLMGAVAVSKEGAVKLISRGDGKPTTLTCEKLEDYLAVIMPIRV